MPLEVLQALRIDPRTLSQQLEAAVESATAPFQRCPRKTGSACVAHVAQALTDMDAHTALLAVNGIGVFDIV